MNHFCKKKTKKPNTVHSHILGVTLCSSSSGFWEFFMPTNNGLLCETRKICNQFFFFVLTGSSLSLIQKLRLSSLIQDVTETEHFILIDKSAYHERSRWKQKALLSSFKHSAFFDMFNQISLFCSSNQLYLDETYPGPAAETHSPNQKLCWEPKEAFLRQCCHHNHLVQSLFWLKQKENQVKTSIKIKIYDFSDFLKNKARVRLLWSHMHN